MPRDDFSERVKQILAERVAYCCSNPDCGRLTIGPHSSPDKHLKVGRAAHIRAASPGGPRYDEQQTLEERSAIKNGIWLCTACADIIDKDVRSYSVTLLLQWKEESEAKVLERLKQGIRLPDSGILDQHSEMLNRIFNQITSDKKVKEQLRKTEQLASDLLEKLRETESELAKLKSQQTNSIAIEAYSAFLDGNLDKAKKLYEDIRDEEARKESQHAVTCYILGNIHFLQLNFKAAHNLYIRASELDKHCSKYLKAAGKTLGMLADFKQSLKYYDMALRLDIDMYGEISTEVLNDLNFIGAAYLGLGEYRNSLEYFERCAKLLSSLAGPMHPCHALYYNNIGIAWRNLEDFDNAIQSYEKALSINLVVLGENHHEVAKNRNNIGNLYMRRGKFKEAIMLFEKALTSDIKTFGPNHPEVAKRWHNIGLCHAQLGEATKAIYCLDKALQSDLNTFGESHPEVSQDFFAKGIAYLKGGDPKSSIPLFEKALALDIKLYGENNPILARRLHHLGLACFQLGDLQRATQYLSSAVAITDGKAHERPRSFTFENP